MRVTAIAVALVVALWSAAAQHHGSDKALSVIKPEPDNRTAASEQPDNRTSASEQPDNRTSASEQPDNRTFTDETCEVASVFDLESLTATRGGLL